MSSRNRSQKVIPQGAHVMKQVKKNDASMSNGLHSAEFIKGMDFTCGIHGAAQARKSAKHATSTARRRNEKEVIQDALSESEESFEDETNE